MGFPVRFTEEAEEDLADAATWFADEVGFELANRFIDLMESTIQKVAETPEHYAVVYRDYRQCVIRPFSHIVTYRIQSKQSKYLPSLTAVGIRKSGSSGNPRPAQVRTNWPDSTSYAHVANRWARQYGRC